MKISRLVNDCIGSEIDSKANPAVGEALAYTTSLLECSRRFFVQVLAIHGLPSGKCM